MFNPDPSVYVATYEVGGSVENGCTHDDLKTLLRYLANTGQTFSVDNATAEFEQATAS
jgi:hypothetical protein